MTYSTRKCDWCRRVRSVRAFVRGATTCTQCVRARALAQEHEISLVRGEGARACATCKVVKRYSLTNIRRSSFPRNAGATTGLHPYCFDCTRAQQRARYRQNPEPWLARSRVINEAMKTDPELKARKREYQRRSRERMRKNPARWAQFLADDRMRRRLQAEREGRVIAMRRSPYMGYGMSPRASELLPEAPLRAWLAAVEQREVGESGDVQQLASLLGVAERQLHGVRDAEYKRRQLFFADKMLTRYGLPIDVPGYGTVWRVEDLWPVELGEREAEAA